jgi:hypothetical protein
VVGFLFVVWRLLLGSPHAKRPPRQRLGSNALVLTGVVNIRVVGTISGFSLSEKRFF